MHTLITAPHRKGRLMRLTRLPATDIRTLLRKDALNAVNARVFRSLGELRGGQSMVLPKTGWQRAAGLLRR
jgi:hypothetical protein